MAVFRKIRTPDGLLLFERRTGVNILLDEMKGRWGWEKPLYVAVQVTNNCNRQCRWCYASSSSSAPGGVWTREKLLNLCMYLDKWGTCLHPDETVIIRRNDSVSQIKVREAKPGDEIISYDIHSRTPCWGKIESVTFRSSKERLKKLVFFPGNRTVVVTADHLIPTLQHGLTKAASIAVGDECFSINHLPERRFTNAPLDLLDFALQLAREDRGINRYYLMNHDSKERIPRRMAKKGNALSITKLADYKGIIDSIDRIKARIRRGYSGYTLPVRIPLSKSLARLIGYYLSEGDTRGFTLNKSEETRIHEITQDYKSVFGYTLRTYQTENRQAIQLSGNIWFNDFVFARLLGCGKGAPEKRIPDIAFNLENELVVELLRGLMGDGNLRHARDKLSINYKTTSLQLSKGIRLLLLCLGIPSSVTSSVGKPRTIENRKIRLYQRKSYAVTIYGRHNIQKLLRVVQLDPRAVKLDLRARISKYSNTKFLSDKKCVLKSIEDVDAPDFVVDLRVNPTNLFVAGDGLVVHNCGVAFGGGEPFTFPGFASLAREVWDSTGLDVGATSNGDLVTDEDLATMKGHFGQLRVSVWHPSEVQSKVVRLLGRGVDIGINTILFKDGFDLVRRIVEEGVRAGIDDLLVLACKPYGRAAASMAPSQDDAAQLCQYIRDQPNVRFKADPELSVMLAAKGVEFLQPWVEPTSGPRFLSITYDGYVKRDSFTDERVRLLQNEQLPEIYSRFYHSREGDGGWARISSAT